MNKRLDELPIPDDLLAEGMVRALSTDLGVLWRADAIQLLGTLDTGSVDLVGADPPYPIAKET